MSYMHPVYAILANVGRFHDRLPTHEEAFRYLPDEFMKSNGKVIPDGLWSSASHNWWYQSVVKAMCAAYPGFDELLYLAEIVAVVQPTELKAKRDSIHKLIAAIRANPAPFVDCTSWYGESASEVLKGLDEATVSRDIDDDTYLAFSNFFSFLISQAAALDEASEGGRCLLYFQPQP